MLGVIRGIVRPENTTTALVPKAVGAGTSHSRSQIRNMIHNPIATNNLIAKLNGTRKRRDAIYSPVYNHI